MLEALLLNGCSVHERAVAAFEVAYRIMLAFKVNRTMTARQCGITDRKQVGGIASHGHFFFGKNENRVPHRSGYGKKSGIQCAHKGYVVEELRGRGQLSKWLDAIQTDSTAIC